MATPYIKIEQTPLRLTPTKTEHVYTVLAPDELLNLTDFRYVFDIWFRPYAGSGGYYPDPAEFAEFVTRIKVKPNSFDKGIVDISKIIENKIKPNIRSEQYYNNPTGSNQASKYTPNNTIPTTDTLYFSNSNGHNLPRDGYSFNSYYDELWHVEEYRVLVGYEFRNTTTGLLEIVISDEPYKPETVFYSDAAALLSTWFGADYNGIEWFNAGLYLLNNTLWGVNYKHTNSTETVIISSNSTTTFDGSYVSIDPPTCGDKFIVTEKYSGYSEVYVYNCAPGKQPDNVIGWEFLEYRYTDETDASLSPASVLTWPGRTNNKTVNRSGFYEGSSDFNKFGTYGHLYYNVFDYYMKPTGVTYENPCKFLNTFGEIYSTNSLPFGVTNNIVSSRIRTRKHHRECPMITSFFNTNVFEFFNDVYGIVVQGDLDPTALYSYNVNTNNLDPEVAGGGPRNLITEPTISTTIFNKSYKIQYHVVQPETINSLTNNRLYVWATKYADDILDLVDYDNTGISEILEYDLVDSDCINNPIHFIFLNDQGVWDTYTFDKKSQKTYEIEKKSFKKGISYNKSAYQRIDNKSSNEVYHNKVEEVVTAQSWYMTENDRDIVEQLYRSSDVYIIKEYEDGYNDNPLAPNGFYKYRSLVPVVIEDNKVDEYKNNYEKLFQYTITFRYTPIIDFNSAR